MSETDQKKHEKTIPIPIFSTGNPELQKQVPKILENAVWWDSYLPLAAAQAKRMEAIENNGSIPPNA